RLWPPPWRAMAPLFLGLLLAQVVLRLTRDPVPEGESILGAAQNLAGFSRFPSNLLAFAGHLALALPLTLPWAILRFSHLRLAALKYLTVVAAVIILLTTSPYTVWVAPVIGLSVLALYDMVKDGLRRGDWLQVVLSAWIFLALPVAIYVHLPSKY